MVRKSHLHLVTGRLYLQCFMMKHFCDVLPLTGQFFLSTNRCAFELVLRRSPWRFNKWTPWAPPQKTSVEGLRAIINRLDKSCQRFQ